MNIDIIKCELKEFDMVIEFAKGSITVVNSKIGQGKTSFLVSIANSFSNTNKKVMFCGSHQLNKMLQPIYVVSLKDIQELKNMIDKKEPDVVIIDNFDYMNPTHKDLSMLKETYKNIVFIISHQLDNNGNNFDGRIQFVADTIYELERQENNDLKIKLYKARFNS